MLPWLLTRPGGRDERRKRVCMCINVEGTWQTKRRYWQLLSQFLNRHAIYKFLCIWRNHVQHTYMHNSFIISIHTAQCKWLCLRASASSRQSSRQTGTYKSLYRSRCDLMCPFTCHMLCVNLKRYPFATLVCKYVAFTVQSGYEVDWFPCKNTKPSRAWPSSSTSSGQSGTRTRGRTIAKNIQYEAIAWDNLKNAFKVLRTWKVRSS